MNREIVARDGNCLPKEELETAERMSLHVQLVYECLRWTHASPDSDAALSRLMAFVGVKFGCRRVCIFEQNETGRYSNTHEWCAPGVAAQKELRQDECQEMLDWCSDILHQGHEVVLRDVEDIREDYPMSYAALRAQGVCSLAMTGLWNNDRLLGFFGAEDPLPDGLNQMSVFMKIVGNFVSSFLRQRDQMAKLKYISYHDQLTGVWSNNKLEMRIKQWKMVNSMGVVYCDITALKQVNDTLGHDAGDMVIQHCAQMVSEVFGKESVYRVGGDEFLVLCPNIEREKFYTLVDLMKRIIAEGNHPMAVGSMWTDQKPLDLNRAISQADADMYESKRTYYAQTDPVSGERRDRRRSAVRTDCWNPRRPAQSGKAQTNSQLERYLQNNYFDSAVLLQSVGESGTTCFLYFGDMQTGIFYITDNLRDTFGFEGNVVPDFINAWERRISNQEDLELFRQDIRQLLGEKKERHDLYYRVRDQQENNFWIHCRGLLQWDAAREKPLFFSGCVIRQEPDFVVDIKTNFLRENAALFMLDELKRDGGLNMVVGFSLNHFSEINESRGRDIADELLRTVSNRLNEHFGHRVFFYRLDGLRFIAVPASDLQDEDLAQSIREIVRESYWERGIIVRQPCSVSVLRQPALDSQTTPQSILDTVMTMIVLAKHAPEQEVRDIPSNEIRLKKEQAELVLELNRSVINGCTGFRIVIQPIVSIAGDIVGGEALLRWAYSGKDVPPDQFIPLLEKNKLILQVGRWTFEEVARICKRIVTCRPDFPIGFNVSYHQLADEDFPGFMGQTLEQFGLDGSHLVMELTETHFDETPEKLHRFVSSCKGMGMKVVLDDFGSGYSSLTLLLRYPADIVKLDRALLAEITHSEDKAKFIGSIVYACHQFGKRVCMEGVETDEDLSIIRQAQCDMVQGFHFYKPLELRDFYRLLLSDDSAAPVPQTPQS